MRPSLLELQRALSARVLSGEGPASPSAGSSAGLAAMVVVPPGVDPLSRIAVYADGYPARIGESLRESFPALAHVLGHGAFRELAGRFLPVVEPAAGNLNYVGETLPAFLRDDELTRGLPFLPDLAALEWRVVEAFHSAIEPRFDLASCASWSVEDWQLALLGFQPSLALVRSPWPILEVCNAADLDTSQINIDMVGRPEQVLVYRDGFEVVRETISEHEAIALEELLGGATLGEAVAELASAGADADAVTGFFSRWASRGLVTRCTVKAPTSA